MGANFVPKKHNPIRPSKQLTDLAHTLDSIRLAVPDGKRQLQREKQLQQFRQEKIGKYTPVKRWQAEQAIRGIGQKVLHPGTYIIWNGRKRDMKFLARHPMGGCKWTEVLAQAIHFDHVMCPSFLKSYGGKPLRSTPQGLELPE